MLLSELEAACKALREREWDMTVYFWNQEDSKLEEIKGLEMESEDCGEETLNRAVVTSKP